MSASRKLIVGGLNLAMGHGAAQVLGLARNFMVARLLAPEQFGIAATFVVTIAIIEASTQFGLDKYLVQSTRGDDPQLQKLIHSFSVARGLVLGLALFLGADLIAGLFGIPEVAGSFQVLALLPVLRGFAHSDVKRVARALAFRADAVAMVAAQAASVVVAVGLALILRDYTAMLWAVMAHSAVGVAASHLLAERRYGLAFDAADLRGVLAFGWPLTLNGLVVVGVLQGDRVVVGGFLGMEQLGYYAAVTMLLHAVVGLSGAVIGGVAFPWVAAAKADRAEFLQRHQVVGVVFVLVTVAVFAPMTLIGADVVAVIFGANYRPGDGLMAALGLTAAVRFLHGWPGTAGLALGETRALLVGNLVRPLGLGLAALAGAQGMGLAAVALAVGVGELVALAATMLWLRRAVGLPLRPAGWIVGPGGAILLACALWTDLGPEGLAGRVAVAVLALAAALASLGATPQGRRLVRGVAAPALRRLGL